MQYNPGAIYFNLVCCLESEHLWPLIIERSYLGVLLIVKPVLRSWSLRVLTTCIKAQPKQGGSTIKALITITTSQGLKHQCEHARVWGTGVHRLHILDICVIKHRRHINWFPEKTGWQENRENDKKGKDSKTRRNDYDIFLLWYYILMH